MNTFCYISELLGDNKVRMASNKYCSENVSRHTEASKDDIKDRIIETKTGSPDDKP